MKGYTPGLFDRLMEGPAAAATSAAPHSGASGVLARLSVEDLKDSVARDLEALLNTRTVLPEEMLRPYPECARSILSYGLNDFAGLSLASTDDRAYICQCLERAIARHEPRLRNVRAALEVQESAINRLNFAIAALLVVDESQQAVSFDAVLQPSSLHYTISRARRAPAAGA